MKRSRGIPINDIATRRRGFSLIELLTVIGIVMILIALLMPTLVRARQSANALACQSNLRQIFHASMSRSIEHGGYVQLGGSINGMDEISPAALGDPDEKRYLWFDDDGVRRPAPLQAALAPYLGERHVRLDNRANLVADCDRGMIRKIFTCPAQVEPLPPGVMIGAIGIWDGVRIPTSYAYNEGLLGYEAWPHRLRGKLTKANPPAEIIFMSDAVPRTEGGGPYIAWFPPPQGHSTLADVLSNVVADGHLAGLPSQFDYFRHPRFRMNVVFCDGHGDSLIINERDLRRGVLMAE